MTTTLQREPTGGHSESPPLRLAALLPYLAIGIVFGVILVESQVVSWYRIQEMFRFQSFHMYGVLGSAWATALIGLRALRRTGAVTFTGGFIGLPPKELGTGRRYWMGGAVFGIGWALSGACPGPLFALIGSGSTVYAVTALSALAGAWVYGALRARLPH